MIIPANILCKHSRVNNPWRTILPTKTNMDARHCRTELKTMSSLVTISSNLGSKEHWPASI